MIPSLKPAFLIFIGVFIYRSGMGQCPITVNSSDGYQVQIIINPIALVPSTTNPGSCLYGYSYEIQFEYDVTFSGTNIPSKLDNLQGNFTCNDGSTSKDSYFSIPITGGNAIKNSAGGQYRNNNDCATATLDVLGCNTLSLNISGPGISYQTVSCNNILPIELLSFMAEARNAAVELTWITASEQNNDYFTIERSADGVVWETVETLPGAGNSYENLMYQTVDRSPLPGQSYYRLKQTDFDGQFSYSDIKPISMGAVAAQEMQLFPNPTNGQITIDGVSGGIKSIAIFNALGQRVDTQIPISAQSDTRLLVDMSTLPSGIYTVNADGAARKFFKQ